VFAHLVDLADPAPLADRVETIRAEVAAYAAELDHRPWLLVGTKLDLVADRGEVLAGLESVAAAHGVAVLAVSAATREGIDRLLGALFRAHVAAEVVG
jgi:GTPase involved in cell partitioning and DNA repair